MKVLAVLYSKDQLQLTIEIPGGSGLLGLTACGLKFTSSSA